MNKDNTSDDNSKVFSKNSILESLSMVSGNGQFHTAKPGAKHSRPYGKITFNDITRMVNNPVNVPKGEAPWAIFSTFGGPLARSHEEQRNNGRFCALWADLDEVGTLTVLEVSQAIESILPGVMRFIYNTKGATPDNLKCRIIVPLATPCTGADFVLYQKIFNNKLDAAGALPDRANERAAQLCYLPNRGDVYDSVIVKGVLLK